MAKKAETENKKCPHCSNAPHPKGTNYCPFTGKHLQNERSEIENLKIEKRQLVLEKEELEKKKTHRGVIIYSLLIVALIGIFFSPFYKKQSEKKTKQPDEVKPIQNPISSGNISLDFLDTKDKKKNQQLKNIVKTYLANGGVTDIKEETNKTGMTFKGKPADKSGQVTVNIHMHPQKPEIPAEINKRNILKLETELSQVKAERKKLKEKLTEEQDNGKKLVNEKEGLERKIATKEAEIKNLHDKISTLNENIAEKEKNLKEEKREKNGLKEKCYNAYLSLAEKYYKHRDWNKALAAIQKTLTFRTMREATEAIQLRERIYKMKKERGDEKIVNFLNLPHDMKNKYIAEIEKIDMLILPGEIDVKGELNLILSVTSDGKIVIQEFIDDYIIVSPENQINVVKERISKRIEGTSLSPPKEKSNNSVRVEYWGVRFKLKTLRGEMKLTFIK